MVNILQNKSALIAARYYDYPSINPESPKNIDKKISYGLEF